MDLYKLACEIEAGFAADAEAVCHYVFCHPELGLQEYESAAYLADFMKARGFSVEKPYCGLETAFCAVYGEEGPQIDFMAEYDALPGYGEDKHNAHACGHNWIAGASVAGALTMAELVKRGLLKARIRLLGTPAEENYGGKIVLVREGAFRDSALVMETHLCGSTDVAPSALAMNSYIFNYTGKASHAAAAPWDGVNALDAVNLLFAGVNCLRQHVKPDVRIHGIVTYGGLAPNIVPDKASAHFYVRGAQREYLNTVIEKVFNVAKGAALMTGAELSWVEPDLPFDDLRMIESLSLTGERYARAEGLDPEYTAANRCSPGGSTDVGNVSYAAPTFYMEAGTPDLGFRAHEVSAIDVVDSPKAYEILHKSARVMCGVALEQFENDGFAKIKKEFLALNK